MRRKGREKGGAPDNCHDMCVRFITLVNQEQCRSLVYSIGKLLPNAENHLSQSVVRVPMTHFPHS